MKRLCKYYFRELLNVEYFIFEHYLSTEDSKDKKIRYPLEQHELDTRLQRLIQFIRLGCVVMIVIDVPEGRKILLS